MGGYIKSLLTILSEVLVGLFMQVNPYFHLSSIIFSGFQLDTGKPCVIGQ